MVIIIRKCAYDMYSEHESTNLTKKMHRLYNKYYI